MPSPTCKPVILIIRDGWGHNPDPSLANYDATHAGKTPTEDKLKANSPSTLIKTCGLDVGLPPGTMGNSEVGHQNIGAGRIVDQEIVRISKAISTGEFFKNPVLLQTVDFARKNNGKIHLMGLVSDAGVHSIMEHLYACLKMARQQNFDRIFVHAFMDGRDTPPTSGLGYIRQLEEECKKIGVGRIVSVSGRYYAMDRDKRWDRVQKAYECLVFGKGLKCRSAAEAVQNYYDKPDAPNRSGDEFITPTNLVDDQGSPLATIGDGDSVIFFNFRGDRPREITHSLVDAEFSAFPRGKKFNLYYATLTEYQSGLPVNLIFPKPEKMKNILGMYLADPGLKQFRCAETEKYAHVTFFFNDYREEPFPGEDRFLVASPKVATYDMQPEMSAIPVCDEMVKRVLSKQYDLGVVNFANGDMVGHTGSLAAAVKAVETVDQCVGRILEAAQKTGASVVITADHGNCEQMYDPVNKMPHTSHTTNDAPLYVVSGFWHGKTIRPGGCLADIAPTILSLMGLKQPGEMTGKSLV
ncbi:MAG: 2,3-bisphosphoglycerate-independent phosphoglycerate mutase [Verrucomicrobiae bacterium]|nr:2,3-bisphosphoglycerate-independent phosphoglycerate mutase [Verrucomicrobiae bacterium]